MEKAPLPTLEEAVHVTVSFRTWWWTESQLSCYGMNSIIVTCWSL